MNMAEKIFIDCPYCGDVFDVVPRDPSWARRQRRVKCSKCSESFRCKDCLYGTDSDCEPEAVLVEIDERKPISIKEFDCERPTAVLFADLFRQVWDKLPPDARRSIVEHWQTKIDAPAIWITRDDEALNRNSWAHTSPDGYGMRFSEWHVSKLPSDHVQLLVAHELGHTLCIAVEEPSHLAKPTVRELKYRPEWIVWQLMQKWGFDQLATEIWMEQNVEFINGEFSLRSEAKDFAEVRDAIHKEHERIESELADKSIPDCLEKWLSV